MDLPAFDKHTVLQLCAFSAFAIVVLTIVSGFLVSRKPPESYDAGKEDGIQ
jgi:hypothetical protein